MQSGSCHLIYPYSACTGEAEAEIFPGGEGKLHFELAGDGLKSLSDVANGHSIVSTRNTLYFIDLRDQKLFVQTTTSPALPWTGYLFVASCL